MKLIDKIKAEVEKKTNGEQGYSSGDAECGYQDCAKDILSFLDTLEVKEVDLEKELETLDSLFYDLDGVAVKGATSYLTVEDVKDIAKHFFELGLKVKGE